MADFQQVAVPGADWEDVADTLKPRAFKLYSQGSFGPEPGAEARWNRERFEAQVANGGTVNGFVLLFQPAAGEAWDVHFDGAGKVQFVEEPITGADLLNGTATEKMKTF